MARSCTSTGSTDSSASRGLKAKPGNPPSNDSLWFRQEDHVSWNFDVPNGAGANFTEGQIYAFGSRTAV